MNLQQHLSRFAYVLSTLSMAIAPAVAAQSLDARKPVEQAPQGVAPYASTLPNYGPIILVPEFKKDTRTAKQRCVDAEAKTVQGTLSDLDKASIDLKCSQR